MSDLIAGLVVAHVAPISRFSSTLICGKMWRPSGTWQMPRLTIFRRDWFWIGWPRNENLAVARRRDAADRHQRRVLPAPLAPIR